ncbi:MAG TPA: GNAT family protein [Thermomicrobiales bacterium]|nr:GNAT family protein [Thermomicrobiales bacterium]
MRIDPIETPRLRLRQFRPDDWRAVHAYAADAELMTYLDGGALDAAGARAFAAANAGDGAEAFAVAIKPDDRPIGHLLFHPWFAPRTFEIGWVLDRAHHGRGYATEAAAALLRYGFVTLSLHRVIATCQPENPASARVMEKVGMRREGWFRQCIARDDGAWWDEWFYAVLAEEWFARERERAGRDAMGE